jgi:CBS domain-containing protein
MVLERVKSVMRSPVVTSSLSETVSSIAEKLISNDIGAIVVIRGDSKPVGIITERDIVEIVRTNKDSNKTNAKDIMSSPLVTIEVDLPLLSAIELMRKKGIRRVGVTQNNKLVGVVTERRLLNYLYTLVKSTTFI